MNKTIAYRGKLDMDTEDRIKLSTLNGKTGYKIKKFKIMSTTPGTGNKELVGKITSKTDDNIGPAVDFSDSELLAVAYLADRTTNESSFETIIFDNKKFNQDIFVAVSDATSNTVPVNYYIELETMPLTDLEATFLTLQNIKTIAN
jgi:hypothetical protein